MDQYSAFLQLVACGVCFLERKEKFFTGAIPIIWNDTMYFESMFVGRENRFLRHMDTASCGIWTRSMEENSIGIQGRSPKVSNERTKWAANNTKYYTCKILFGELMDSFAISKLGMSQRRSEYEVILDLS